jgi:hypothetical protein
MLRVEEKTLGFFSRDFSPVKYTVFFTVMYWGIHEISK